MESFETDITVDRIDKEPLRVLVNEKTTELYGWTAESLASPVPDEDYGYSWPKGVTQWFIEAYGYRHGGLGGHDKLYHMVNMIKIDVPSFQFTARGYINSNALRVLKACCEHPDLGIAGAASTGKTYPVGAWVYEDWKSAPQATLAFVCTTSLAASEDRIWGAIVKMHQESTIKVGVHIPHKNVIAWGKFTDKAIDRDFNAAIKAVAIPEGNEGKKAIAQLRGRKQLNVTLVLDELPEMEKYALRGAVNLEANVADEQINAFGLRVIGIGNPMDENDAHGEMLRPDHPLGFKSITKNTPEWKTRTGWAIFLNGEWSPNFEAPESEPIPFPRLTNRKVLARMLERCHGNPNSLEYWRNAIGFWPNAGVVKTVLTSEIIIAKNANKNLKWRTITRKKVAGFDTGFSAGGDKCVLRIGEVGRDEFNRMVLSCGKEFIFHVEVGDDFETSIARQVVDTLIKEGVDPDGFGMDVNGDGGKILAAIIRYWIEKNRNAVNVVAISSMEAPSERIVSNVDRRQCKEAFDRKVTEYWMMVREAVLCEVIRNFPLVNERDNSLTDVADQFFSRTFEIKGKKFSIESKDDYIERTSKGSPDNADAMAYMVEMARRHGLEFETPSDTDRVKERSKQREIEKVFSRVDRGDDSGYESDDWGEPDGLLAA
jgi:hypothetical protein